MIQNNNYSKALPVYQELIKIKPDSEAGYLGLISIFVHNGDKKTANEIARQGLAQIPESKKLQELLK